MLDIAGCRISVKVASTIARTVLATVDRGESILFVMAYDEELAGRIRELLVDAPGVTESRMFGGLAFLVGGHMAIAASGQGGALVHIDPATSQAVLADPTATLAVMNGRIMNGWVRVDSHNLHASEQLCKWVDLGVGFARSLPPKHPKPR